MREWGWTTPALVGEDGGLIAGHARILAARQLGISEIPVMVLRAIRATPPHILRASRSAPNVLRRNGR